MPLHWLRLALLLVGTVARPLPKSDVPRLELTHPCSRAISRAVRKKLEKEVLRPSTRLGIEKWPDGCQLDPAVDLWGYHEKQKERRRTGSPGASRPGSGGGAMSCGICGKDFKSEHYLDLHMERKHMNDTPAHGVCLADFCDMFEACDGEDRFRPRPRSVPTCDNDTMKVARRRCEDALRGCLRLDDHNVSRGLYAKYSRTFCAGIDCRIRDEKRKEHEEAFIPVIILLILVILIGFVAFSLTLCCVDYSDDILDWLMECGVASADFVKGFRKTRDETKQAVGINPKTERTKAI